MFLGKHRDDVYLILALWLIVSGSHIDLPHDALTNDIAPLQVLTVVEVGRRRCLEYIHDIFGNGIGNIQHARLHLLEVMGNETFGIRAEDDPLQIAQVAQGGLAMLWNGEIMSDPHT
jgi:hypothetical protein